jgi:large subunit ribosomal protein L22
MASYVATHRFAKISPRKVRPLADLIRRKFADEALEILRFQPHRGARLLEKVLQSALANAEDRRAGDLHHLIVTDVRVDGGPMFKRMQPKSRGMASIIKKRMSHIHVELEQLE